MKTIFVLLLTTLILSSCYTPEQALGKRKYKLAFRLATKRIKKGIEVDNNIRILQTAADYIVDKEIKKDAKYINSNKVKDWIKAQDKYYRLLEKLGKSNIVSEGALTPIYDDLCSKKIDLDFKIVDYYFQQGENLLNKFNETGLKIYARQAYYKYNESEKHGAHVFYYDIEELLVECHNKGIVYYIGDISTIGSSFFFKPLPPNANFEPDCDIDIDYGSISTSHSSSSSSRTYTKDIEIGKEEVKDTSGKVISYKPIYKTIEATVTTTTVTITASTWTSIHSQNISGQCTASSESFHTSLSDSYEEVDISGDERAITGCVTEKSGSPFFLESSLVSSVESHVRSALWHRW